MCKGNGKKPVVVNLPMCLAAAMGFLLALFAFAGEPFDFGSDGEGGAAILLFVGMVFVSGLYEIYLEDRR